MRRIVQPNSGKVKRLLSCVARQGLPVDVIFELRDMQLAQ